MSVDVAALSPEVRNSRRNSPPSSASSAGTSAQPGSTSVGGAVVPPLTRIWRTEVESDQVIVIRVTAETARSSSMLQPPAPPASSSFDRLTLSAMAEDDLKKTTK